MPSNESNFVWTSHKLIVEMKKNMFWYWDTSSDSHETTHSKLTLMKDDWRLHARDSPNTGQWTRVITMPSAVVASVNVYSSSYKHRCMANTTRPDVTKKMN